MKEKEKWKSLEIFTRACTLSFSQKRKKKGGKWRSRIFFLHKCISANIRLLQWLPLHLEWSYPCLTVRRREMRRERERRWEMEQTIWPSRMACWFSVRPPSEGSSAYYFTTRLLYSRGLLARKPGVNIEFRPDVMKTKTQRQDGQGAVFRFD